MNGRFLPMVFGSMVLVGAVSVSVPLLVDPGTGREAGPGETAPAGPGAAAASVPRPRDPFGSHRFLRIVESSTGILYGICRDEGLFISYDRGRIWIPRSTGLPQKLTYPFEGTRPRELTSIALDTARSGRIAVTTARELLVSEDSGTSWVLIPTSRPDPKTDPRAEGWPLSSDHFTAVAFDPENPEGYLLGTSFGGFYATGDSGRSWTDPSREAEFLRRGAGMYEEVAAVAWLPETLDAAVSGPGGSVVAATTAGTPARGRSMLVAEGFGGRLMSWNPLTLESRDLGFPGSALGESIHAVWPAEDSGERCVFVSTNRSVWRRSVKEPDWSRLEPSFIAKQPPAEPDEARRARMRKAANKTGIYLSSLQATSRHIDRHLDFIVRHGMNSFVVDCKEDYGYLTYDSELELPRKMGAVKVRFDLDDLLAKAHARGIYVIARVLVFKDRTMYSWENYAHAVWNRETDGPWAHFSSYEDEETGETKLYQREHWIDPFDPFVVDYNIDVARELEARGVDEIQFDYIRFPTDGDLTTAVYRHRRAGMSNADALESFLAEAREAIRIPISTDLYGFNSWNVMGTTNGQSIEMFSRYVDVISPMFYPNHFPLSFMRNVPYFERAARIYREGTRRATAMVAGNSLVRPYVQAFLLRSIAPEETLSTAQSGELLLEQIRAALDAPSSGYTLWNASNDYYMVTTSLTPYGPGR